MGRGLGASSCFPKTARERVLQDRAGCHHCSGRRGEDDPVSRSIALHPRCLAADAGRTCCPTPETTHSQWQQGFPGLQNSQSRQQGDCFFFFFPAHSSSYFTMPVPKANLTSIPNPAVWSSPLLSALCSIPTTQLSVTAGEWSPRLPSRL